MPQKARVRLLPNNRAVIETFDLLTPEGVKHLTETFERLWLTRNPIILSSEFEVIDDRQPDIESRLAAVEQWIKDREANERPSAEDEA